jgi:hypothetical protein
MKTALVLVFSVLFLSVHAQEWEFEKEKDGIRVYTRAGESSNVKSYRGEATFRAPVDQVLKLITDVENFDEWDDDIREMRVLERVEGKSFTYYLVYDVPWPLEDRDLCVKAEITRDPSSGEYVVMAKPAAGLVPERDGIVRITGYWQKWSILPLDDGQIKLSTEGYADPGGQVPSWIVNMAVTDNPLETIEQVRERSVIKN